MNWNLWFGWVTKRSAVFTLMLLVLAAYYVKMLRGYSAPLAVPDEFGYSVIAAYLAGHDWSNVAQGVPWYSYGYSLILAPFYMLIKPSSWYHAAQFINVLLVIAAGVCANALLSKYVRSTLDRYLAVAAVMLYPSIVFYVHFSWSESLIALLPWLVAIQVTRMGRLSSGYLDAVLYGVLLGFCYYIHSRLIVICIAGLMVLAYQAWVGRRTLWASASVIAFAITMFLGALLKDYFIAHVYRGVVKGTQDSLVKETLGLIHRFQDPSVLLTLLSGASGQFAYLVIATMGLMVPGVVYMAVRARQAHSRGKVDESSALSFLLLALLGSYALIAISMGSSPQYPHHVFYGRYTDPLVLPAMAFGLIYCMENRRAALKMALISIALVFLTVPLAMNLAAKLPQGNTYWILIVGLFPYREAGWYLNTHHILLCFSLVMLVLTLLFRLWPRLAGVAVCLAMLSAGVGITRTFQGASSEHTFNWRARLDQPGHRYRGEIVFDASNGDPLFMRTQARMINPDAVVSILTPGDQGGAHRPVQDHLTMRRSSEGMQHLFCDVDESAKIPVPAVCRNIGAGSFKVTARFALGDPKKELRFPHAWMGADPYYFVSTLPYLRTIWPNIGAHRITLRYTTHADFSTVAVVKAFVTKPGVQAWLGERSVRLFVPVGDATGLFKVPVTVRGYDGNPLPPGQYLFHVVAAYPDGNDWSTIATMPMSIH